MATPTLDRVLTTLRSRRVELNRMGVRRVAVFGSVARQEKQCNDIDLLLELDDQRVLDVYDYTGVVMHLRTIFPDKLDIVNHATLKPHVRPSAEAEAIYAF